MRELFTSPHTVTRMSCAILFHTGSLSLSLHPGLPTRKLRVRRGKAPDGEREGVGHCEGGGGMERLRRGAREVADHVVRQVTGKRRSRHETQGTLPEAPPSQRTRGSQPSPSVSARPDASQGLEGRDLVEGRHAFLQALMKRGLVPVDQAQKLHDCALGPGSGVPMGETIQKLNSDLVKLHLRLKKLPCPVSARGHKLEDIPVDERREYLCVVNTVADAMAERSTDLSFAELAFFREVTTLIACDPEESGRLSSTLLANIDVAKVVREMPGLDPEKVDFNAARLRVGQKEALLKRFAQEGWLMPTPGHKGFYSLGMRTLMELRNFLLSLDLPETVRADWEDFI